MMTLSSNGPTPWGARWLAGIGVALLGVAAVSLVSARWEQFGPGSRLAILLGASAVVFGATQLLRRVAPETTRALDVLVAALVPIDVAALVIVSGGTWRPALLAAGLAAMISSEVLGRRDPTFLIELGTATGGVLTMCGFAALYDVSAPLLVAGLGLVAVILAPGGGDRWLGMIWAGLAGLTPGLRVLDDAVFTGMGTMRDLGLLDAAEQWETATAGAVATVALVLAAVLQHRIVAALLAVATAAATGLQLWGEIDPPGTVALIAVAVAVGLVELALALPGARRLPADGTKLIADVNAVIAGMLTLVVGAAAWVQLTEGERFDEHLQYTAAVLAVVWLIGDLRRAIDKHQRGLALYLVGGDWAPALPGLAVAAASAAYLGSEENLVLGLTLAAVGLFGLTTLRPGSLVTAVVALAAAPFLTGDEASVTAVVAAGATWGIAYAARQLGRRTDRTVAGFVGGIGIVTVIPGAIAAYEWGLDYAALYALGVLWLAARVVDGEVPVLATLYRVAAHLGLIALALESLVVAAVAAVVVAAIDELEHRERRQPIHRVLSVGSALLAWSFALSAAEVDTVDLHVLPMVWAGLWGLARQGLERSVTIGLGALFTVLVTVAGRIDDGEPIHSLMLGGSALVLAGWAALHDERRLLAAAGSVAVATAAYEGLAHSVGVETWGWLVVGGTAAITAAVLLESRGGATEEGRDGSAVDDAFVS